MNVKTVMVSDIVRLPADAMALSSHPDVSAALLIAQAERADSVWVLYRPLKRMAIVDAGYCLDAPGLLPAGGCTSFRVDHDMAMTEQLTWARE